MRWAWEITYVSDVRVVMSIGVRSHNHMRWAWKITYVSDVRVVLSIGVT
jgi:hypothetical protein